MLTSMTGFATKSIALPINDEVKVHVTISIKTLNSRFFEANCKVPSTLNDTETKVVALLKKELRRGYVHFVAHVHNASILKSIVEPCSNTIQSYLNAIDTIRQTFPIEGAISMADLMQLPHVFATQEVLLSDDAKLYFIEAVREVAQVVAAERISEGHHLLTDLQQRVAVLQQEIDTLEPAFLNAMKSQKDKVAKNISALDEAEEGREARKNYWYTQLDKMDIHEEIVRFKSHLHSFSTLLENPEPIEKGKRLDFTLQELAREINTIAAKCSDATIGTIAINIKVEVEKAREQVQNIV